MDRTSLVRLRWRLSGAWLWPSFMALTLVDAAIVHWLPPQGDSEPVIAAWLISTALMLAAICFLSPMLGFALRRRRGDLPRTVARNYAGTISAIGVSVALAAAGVVHHHIVTRDRSAMLDASQRAEAWIGDHAPAAYLDNLRVISTIPIQAPQIYRSCVYDTTGTKTYCVVVDDSKPFGTGVSFAGYESNQLLDQGAN